MLVQLFFFSCTQALLNFNCNPVIQRNTHKLVVGLTVVHAVDPFFAYQDAVKLRLHNNRVCLSPKFTFPFFKPGVKAV